MPLFDTHAHLDDPQLSEQLEHFLQLAAEANVEGITAIGTDARSSDACLHLAHHHPNVFAAVGIHPNQCQLAGKDDWNLVTRMIADPRAVAIGETGLDRYWDYSPIELQREWFDRHIELMFDTGKPLVVHMRECEQDILDSFSNFESRGPINGIMHSFAGCWETARRCLEWGMHISFAGMVTFKNASELREIAARIPDDRLLIETDAPYLTPDPHRGKRPNHPAMVQHTAACLAKVRGVPVEELGELTTGNARRIFGIPAIASADNSAL